jgi:hypothetical protein
VEVDHDVGGPLGVDLGEVAGPAGRAGALPEEHDQLPGAQELGLLEKAAVHQHQVVAGPGAVEGPAAPGPVG